MTEDKKSQSENEAHEDEQYTHGYDIQVIDYLQARTVKEQASLSFGKTAAGFIESFAKTAIQLGWTDRNMIEQIKQEWLDWGKNPDAFYMLPYCESVGRKP